MRRLSVSRNGVNIEMEMDNTKYIYYTPSITMEIYHNITKTVQTVLQCEKIFVFNEYF